LSTETKGGSNDLDLTLRERSTVKERRREREEDGEKT
jgi:hypothetical protein